MNLLLNVLEVSLKYNAVRDSQMVEISCLTS